VRRPSSSASVSSPSDYAPLQKYSYPNQSLASLTNVTGGCAVVLQSGVPIDTIGELAALLVHLTGLSVTITSITSGIQIGAAVLLRDATVQPTATVAQFAARALAGDGVTLGATGTVSTPGSYGSNTYLSASTHTGATFFVGGTDSYGNTIKSGDSLVFDIGLTSEPYGVTNQAGTYVLSFALEAIAV
jgi:hypothetical protein